MLKIFSTREVAVAIYLLIFIIYALSVEKIRISLKSLIITACSKKILIPFIILIMYAGVLVLLMSYLPFWKWIYLKDIIIWVIFVGVPMCFKAVERNLKENYFKSSIIDNLKFIVVVEYLVGTFTFNIIVELILQPIIAILSLLIAIFDSKNEYKMTNKFLNAVLTIIGIIILLLTLNEAINPYKTLASIDTVIGLLTPLIFSILYLPFTYGFAIYSRYENIFIRMSIIDSTSKKINRKRKYQIWRVCKLSYKNLCAFEKHIPKYTYKNMTQDEFDDMINRGRMELIK